MNSYAVAVVSASWFTKVEHMVVQDLENPIMASVKALQLLGYDIVPDDYGHGFIYDDSTTMDDLETYLYDEWDIAVSTIKI